MHYWLHLFDKRLMALSEPAFLLPALCLMHQKTLYLSPLGNILCICIVVATCTSGNPALLFRARCLNSLYWINSAISL